MSLRPSPSPSPAPQSSSGNSGGPPPNLKPINTRASLQPQAIPRTPQNPISPRPPGINTGHGRPTSELLGGSNGMFQTPESEAIDQWFENLQNYETTLEEMAAASLDVNFKEELSAIEQWFRVLSEAERTAALYSLLQHSTQMQIRFFITVLQQMARSDPMTALLSPAVGASMQSQMDAKLASMGLKSPGLPASPSARSFSASMNRQSIAGDPPANYLSPDSANNSSGTGDAAATLANQRARLKANATHRISAPGTLINEGVRLSSVWPSSQLGQVAERAPSPNREATLSPPLPSSSRPKSTDFTGVANSFRSPRVAAVQNETQSLDDQLSPAVGGNWASMVNTPLVPMFGTDAQNAQNSNNLDSAAMKLASWNVSNNTNGRMVLDDPRKFRRASANAPKPEQTHQDNNNTAVYGDDGEPIQTGSQLNQGARNNGAKNNNGGFLSAQQNWPSAGPRSPALSNVSSGRFAGDNDALANAAGMNFGMGTGGPLSANAMAAMGMGMGGGMNMPPFNMFNGMNGVPGLSPMAAMNGMNGMNGLVSGMEGLALNPLQQAQIFAAQLAASGYNPAAFGVQGNLQQQNNGRGGRNGGRSPGKASSSLNGRGDGSGSGAKDKDEEIDPAVLNDVPAWLRSLRLHKYTPNFEGMNWKEMVVMDEAALEAKGVAALGARRKLLKTFEAVRAKMNVELPAGAASSP